MPQWAIQDELKLSVKVYRFYNKSGCMQLVFWNMKKNLKRSPNLKRTKTTHQFVRTSWPCRTRGISVSLRTFLSGARRACRPSARGGRGVPRSNQKSPSAAAWFPPSSLCQEPATPTPLTCQLTVVKIEWHIIEERPYQGLYLHITVCLYERFASRQQYKKQQHINTCRVYQIKW